MSWSSFINKIRNCIWHLQWPLLHLALEMVISIFISSMQVLQEKHLMNPYSMFRLVRFDRSIGMTDLTRSLEWFVNIRKTNLSSAVVVSVKSDSDAATAEISDVFGGHWSPPLSISHRHRLVNLWVKKPDPGRKLACLEMASSGFTSPVQYHDITFVDKLSLTLFLKTIAEKWSPELRIVVLETWK